MLLVHVLVVVRQRAGVLPGQAYLAWGAPLQQIGARVALEALGGQQAHP